jgi:dihydroorotate dehydrogenase (NAD+) catalytic subunit
MVEIIEGIGRFLSVEKIAEVTNFIGSLDTSCLFPFAEDSCALVESEMT